MESCTRLEAGGVDQSDPPRMPSAIKAAPDGGATDTANQERILPDWERNNRDTKIPACFIKMSQEPQKNFPHTKQVGNYLVGKMINKGSFAKVMEGLHIPTGEKVNCEWLE